MRLGLIFILIFLTQTLLAQQSVQLLFEELPSDSIPKNDVAYHSSIRPQIRWNSHQYGQHLLKIKKNKTEENYILGLNPSAEFFSSYQKSLNYRVGIGFQMESNFKNKWYFRFNGIAGAGNKDSIYAFNPSYVSKNIGQYEYVDFTGRVSYTPNHIFNFQAGNDYNFIGEGNRSLLLSDYGKPYPFVNINAKFWRINYAIYYQMFQEGNFSPYKSKLATTHYLSFNATKWLNISLFESVVFQPKDTALQRGFDVEYLNPVIFFRPQEYSLGSSDNVLMGVNISAKIKSHTIYSQLVIDEFSLVELKNKTGWWANKFGAQLGAKGRFAIGSSKWFYRMEYNFMRPFTYAHLNEMANYGHNGSVLAHPFGANFHEILAEVKTEYRQFLFKLFTSYFQQGLDKDGLSFGGNIYLPYTLKASEYQNYIGQGLQNNGFRFSLTASWKFSKYGNLNLFLEQHLRMDSYLKNALYIPVVGLKTNIRNDYRNY